MQTVVFICEDRGMLEQESISGPRTPSRPALAPISIRLSPAQVDEVVRAAARARTPSLRTLIADALSVPPGSARAGAPAAAGPGRAAAEGGLPPIDTADPRLSRSLLRGLAMLTRFGPDGRARGIVELAADLEMSPSTAHRYALTLVELGLLERCPITRKYRLPGS